jgi:hypothetical protein
MPDVTEFVTLWVIPQDIPVLMELVREAELLVLWIFPLQWITKLVHLLLLPDMYNLAVN